MVKYENENFSFPSPQYANTDLDNIGDIMDELKNVLAHYYKIGKRLNLPKDKLKEIRGHNSSEADAMNMVIVEWLRKNYDADRFGPPTWKALVDAVKHRAGGNNRAEAERIASRHKKSGRCRIGFMNKSIASY